MTKVTNYQDFLKGLYITCHRLCYLGRRDESGQIIPDGKYRIKILDYEFFVEVTTHRLMWESF